MMTARAAEGRLKRLARPARARILRRFFKTGPGEYGEGDRFLGVTMPEIRRVVGECRDLPLDAVETLLESAWHESRMLALIVLASQFRRARADAGRRRAIYELYLRRTDRINNWDLVDVTAPSIVGAHLFASVRAGSRAPAVLRALARSRNLWERRIAIIATQTFIRHGHFGPTLELADTLMNDEHDLIHKAVGWMLREVGNRDERALRRFLDRRAAAMPRTALRYAVERLSAGTRARYRAKPRSSARSR
jgi:3-methyladenine DNA glycosylase AlkD